MTYQIINDHINDLVNEKWSLEEAKALNKIGLNEQFLIIQGLKILKRWMSLFKNDNDLTNEEKNKLFKIYYQKIPKKSIFKA